MTVCSASTAAWHAAVTAAAAALVRCAGNFKCPFWGRALGRPQQHRTAAKEVCLPLYEASEAIVWAARSSPTDTFLLESGWLSLPDCWLQSCIRFWNQLLALPAVDLYRDVLFDSASTGIGFAKHMQQACNASGSTLNLCILPCGGGGGLVAAPLDISQLRHLRGQLSSGNGISNGTNNSSSGWRPQP